MELKWFMIGWAVMMTAFAADQAFEKYSQSQCKLAYVQSGKTSDEIKKICE